MSHHVRFELDGTVRAVWDDDLADFFLRAFGPAFAAQRRRASLILTVTEGPYAGCFYADMSHLAELTGDVAHRVCLLPPRQLESQCKNDEVAYIEEHFIKMPAAHREDTD